MRLTRREALKALAGGGIASGGTVAVSEVLVQTEFSQADQSLSEQDFATLEAVANTVYPSEFEVTREFVQTYVSPLSEERKEAISRATDQLNEFTRSRYGAGFTEMSPSTRDAALRSVGADRAMSRPDGNRSERIRYHLVNSLLYALFVTPEGCQLVGMEMENPDGYPGGFAVYRNQMNGDE